MLVEKPGQADRFLAEFVTDHLVWLGRAVSFSEEQIEHFQNRGKSTGKLPDIGRLERLDALP
jgi:hypothetical protein